MNRREMMLASTAAVTGLTGLKAENKNNLPILILEEEDNNITNLKELFVLAGEWQKNKEDDNFEKSINVYLPKKDAVRISSNILYGKVKLKFEFYTHSNDIEIFLEKTENSTIIEIPRWNGSIYLEDDEEDFYKKDLEKYAIRDFLNNISDELQNGNISPREAQIAISRRLSRKKANISECHSLAAKIRSIANLPNAKELALNLK
jgi:hypothetical protein